MPGKSKKGGGLEFSPVYKKRGFKMKGSPLQRNGGFGKFAVPGDFIAPGFGRTINKAIDFSKKGLKKGLKKAWQKYGPAINKKTKTYDLGFDTYKVTSSLGKKKKATRVKKSKEKQGAKRAG